MHAPQIVTIVLWMLSLGIAIEQHGKPKTGNHSVGPSLVSVVIHFAILYWGGFWTDP